MGLFQPGYLPAQTLAGRTFIGSTTSAGIDFPAENATAQTFGLWNPAGSGRNLVLVRFTAGYVNATTPVITGMCMSYLPNTGSAIATGAPISAFTETAPISGMFGNAVGRHVGRFTLAATITAPTFGYSLGLSQNSTTPGTGTNRIVHEWCGDTIIPPGVYVGFGAADAAMTENMTASLVWFEIDE